MPPPFFVDCHSHVIPSGDDGAQTDAEGVELCDDAARHGTAVLFATPHVWPHLPLTDEREAEIRAHHAAVAERARLELRLGFELTPTVDLLADDPSRYVLGGTDAVLMEVPFAGPVDELLDLAAHAEAAGLRPLVAHPERSAAVLAEPRIALELADRGWPLQLNATSLTGYHGAAVEELAWRLLEWGVVAVVASDGHRKQRPPELDRAFAAVTRRFGRAIALPLFDGSALGVRAATAPAAARAASRDA